MDEEGAHGHLGSGAGYLLGGYENSGHSVNVPIRTGGEGCGLPPALNIHRSPEI
ncbi:hypothetical protein AUCHE_08_06150 [Austwickia chelonae NBRC 105200]|uniref:Uncharacterized protein n=1 Tax=Austwickia chelonae NBRC 105200 TaxID=1184607 RepID=K6V815_9MICO|nr:hypothetical protein AUCHE_08_06150 [Austwickia chelonae NBRC 105200]